MPRRLLNTGLAAREWVAVKESESRDVKCVHFAVLISFSEGSEKLWL